MMAHARGNGVSNAVLAAAEARSEKQAADFARREAQYLADLAAERHRADTAIDGFEAFAQDGERESRPGDRRIRGSGEAVGGDG
jgi:hypothetical protein